MPVLYSSIFTKAFSLPASRALQADRRCCCSRPNTLDKQRRRALNAVAARLADRLAARNVSRRFPLCQADRTSRPSLTERNALPRHAMQTPVAPRAHARTACAENGWHLPSRSVCRRISPSIDTTVSAAIQDRPPRRTAARPLRACGAQARARARPAKGPTPFRRRSEAITSNAMPARSRISCG